MTKKPNARTFGQDLMRGEHVVGTTKKKGQTEDLRGGLTHRTTTDPYRDRGKKTRGLAFGTQQWVQDKIASGDIDGGMASEQTGTSIFDPVLCELVYRWFCPPGGAILDPFSGGSVRGIVASHLGRPYTGIDLRAEQLDANRAQLKIARKPYPEWVHGDSRTIAKLLPAKQTFDLVFSCTPYWNLEVYSEDKRDLSTLGADDFFTAQAAIIKAACDRLKPDRFAAWVVGDVRDSKGLYVNIPGRSVEAFEAAGLRLYNECILVTAAGSLAMRTGKQFTASRKLGKTHQNLLVFVKGDPVKATKAVGPCDFGDIDLALAAEEGSADLASYGKVL